MKAHGGGVLKLLQKTGLRRQELLDFSASINPLGLPASVKIALNESLSLLTDYPEIDAASLREALAAHHALPKTMVLPANGSTSLIYLLPRVFKPRRVTLIAPCFSEYRAALEQHDCQVDEFVLAAEDDFSCDIQALLNSLHPDTELVWLANPGNPTGAGIVPEVLLDLAAELGPRLLVVDEAFVDFCPQLSLAKHLPCCSNLLLLRSMTKFYAIPGLRVGYLLAAEDIVRKFAAASEPWNLSTPAILAARACLIDETYRQQSLRELPKLCAEFSAALIQHGLRVFPSVANFLLLRLPEGPVKTVDLMESLCSQGVMVRDCTDFSGLDEHYLRLAVRSNLENSRLLELLPKF